MQAGQRAEVETGQQNLKHNGRVQNLGISKKLGAPGLTFKWPITELIFCLSWKDVCPVYSPFGRTKQKCHRTQSWTPYASTKKIVHSSTRDSQVDWLLQIVLSLVRQCTWAQGRFYLSAKWNFFALTMSPHVWPQFRLLCLRPASYPDVSLARAKEGGKETTGKPAVCTLPMVPCGSSPVARLYLAKNEAPEKEAGLRLFCWHKGSTSSGTAWPSFVHTTRGNTGVNSAIDFVLTLSSLFVCYCRNRGWRRSEVSHILTSLLKKHLK